MDGGLKSLLIMSDRETIVLKNLNKTSLGIVLLRCRSCWSAIMDSPVCFRGISNHHSLELSGWLAALKQAGARQTLHSLPSKPSVALHGRDQSCKAVVSPE